MANKTSKDVVVKVVFILAFFLINEICEICYPIGMFSFLHFRRDHPSAHEGACFANQRVILGAVEMYNMDAHDQLIDSESVASPAADILKILCEEKYIKYIPECGKNGKYEFYASKSGEIAPYCSFHGPVKKEDSDAPGINQEFKDKLAAQKRKELTKKMMPILIYGGLIALAIIF